MFLQIGMCENILENLSDGVYFVDTDRKILYWNKKAEGITGFTRKEVVNSHCYDNILRHIDDKGTELCKEKCPLVYAIKNNTYVEKQVYLHHKNGQRIPIIVKALPVSDDNGNIIGAVEIFNEAIEQTTLKNELEKLRELAYIDDLTGILNRRGLEFFLNEKIHEVKRYSKKIAVLFIDLDDFKYINDRFGHHIGDKTLKMISETLKNNLRANDIVARFGGDEFIIISEIKSEEDLETLSKKIISLIKNSFFQLSDGNIIKTSASIGGALIKTNDTINNILKRTDKLMYVSKIRSKNDYTIDNN
jgi:diguanylate cyclase (GGDEF)-like protein/PAS domain S-box-containing protein